MRGITVLAFMISLMAFNFWNDSHALSTDQILALRKAGVSDKTIRIMLQQESDATSSLENGMGQKELRDDKGNVSIVYSTGHPAKSVSDEESQNVDKAWEMLRHIIIDKRSN